jgi:hypothetical protein
MYTNQNRDAITTTQLGFHVSRPTATLPQTATGNLFTVAGGRCLVKLLFGEVTTAIQNSDPVAKITLTPTVGSAVDVASTVDLSSLEIGGKLMVEGDGTALVKGNAGGAFFAAGQHEFVATTGTIDMICGASKTGSVKWDLWYVPLDEGAAISAA